MVWLKSMTYNDLEREYRESMEIGRAQMGKYYLFSNSIDTPLIMYYKTSAEQFYGMAGCVKKEMNRRKKECKWEQ